MVIFQCFHPNGFSMIQLEVRDLEKFAQGGSGTGRAGLLGGGHRLAWPWSIRTQVPSSRNVADAWKDGLVTVSVYREKTWSQYFFKSWPNINPLDVNYDNYVDSDPWNLASGKETVWPWESPVFHGVTNLPTPMTGRVVYVNLLEGNGCIFAAINWRASRGWPVRGIYTSRMGFNQ